MLKFSRGFKVRIILILAFNLLLALISIGRVAAIVLSEDDRYLNNTVSVFLESGRGDFYYTNGEKVTSNKTKFANVFLPCKQAEDTYFSMANESEKAVGEKTFSNNKPAVLLREEKISGTGIYAIEVSDRYENFSSMEHIIGYINGENEGVFALEKGYNDILKNKEQIRAEFFVDAKGEYLLGVYPKISGTKNKNKVHLTINADIQKICDGAMSGTKKGAVVVSEIENGKIRAMVSKPSFDITKLSDYLESEDSPFLNRATASFSVGSVFKPLIAAALCENKKQNFVHNCTGNSEISGINFHCYNRSGHGEMKLYDAICQSCNCYFYNAANLLPPKKYTSLAASLMFGNKIELANSITAPSGYVTSSKELENPAALANFSIGQGRLLLSPLAINNLYCAIANDGVYFSPSIIEGITVNGRQIMEESGVKTTVFSSATAAELKQYLSGVVSFGTGKAARPYSGGAAGKTATAQTGKFVGKTEIINSWFCGFFPLESPKYAITVFLEDFKEGDNAATEIFKNIADSIIALES